LLLVCDHHASAITTVLQSAATQVWGRNLDPLLNLGCRSSCLRLVLYIPFIRQFIRFSMLNGNDPLLCLAVGLLSVLWFEGLKMMTRGNVA
jgi:hypothetical protein